MGLYGRKIFFTGLITCDDVLVPGLGMSLMLSLSLSTDLVILRRLLVILHHMIRHGLFKL